MEGRGPQAQDLGGYPTPTPRLQHGHRRYSQLETPDEVVGRGSRTEYSTDMPRLPYTRNTCYGVEGNGVIRNVEMM